MAYMTSKPEILPIEPDIALYGPISALKEPLTSLGPNGLYDMIIRSSGSSK